MKTVTDFLDRLAQNNNRQWFAEHKEEYQSASSIFNQFVERLIEGIASFDPSVNNLTVKDCTYRIYRDIRFSKDKLPYKTHMGAFISPGGKCSGSSGYYFHIEAKDAHYIGGHILSTGIYCPAPQIVKGIREEIMFNGQEFEQAIEAASGFSLDRSSSLKRVPAGFSSESQYAEYLKLKDFFLVQHIDDNLISHPALAELVAEQFKKTYQFNSLLNKVVGNIL